MAAEGPRLPERLIVSGAAAPCCPGRSREAARWPMTRSWRVPARSWDTTTPRSTTPSCAGWCCRRYGRT
ncbi:hypothetical protein [Streptomyces antioxidans]|uniref:hypothetical protein n=1 Tax=Streptomyces TaxID=1883 RepID=UPI003B83813D